MTGEEFVDAGDSVVVRVRQRGVGPSSGIGTEIRYFQVITFRGGSIVHMESLPDRSEALALVGLAE